MNSREIENTINLTDVYKPKYLQMVDILSREIETGNVCSGSRFYSEAELRSLFNVSSTTARKCLDLLKQRNLIHRVQGKGTFVRKVHLTQRLTPMCGFTQNMNHLGYEASTKVVHQEILMADEDIASKLHINQGERVLYIKRLRLGAKTPMVLESSYISCALCPGIEWCDLSQSLSNLYRDKYNHRLGLADYHLQLLPLEKDVAFFLESEPGDIAVRITSTIYNGEDVPIEFEESWYLRDFCEFTFQVHS